MKRWTSDDIAAQLKALGIGEGDLSHIKIDFRRFGFCAGNPAQVFVEGYFKVTGPTGGIMVSAFQNAQNLRRLKIDDEFEPHVSVASNGGLARYLLSLPEVVRSTHPSNSVLGLGWRLHAIVAAHDAQAPMFQPFVELFAARGKQINIGCHENNPGFTSVHVAQVAAGLASQNVLSGRQGLYYRDATGQKQLFVRREFGGCPMGFGKFYRNYIEAGILATGMVGSAYTTLVPGAGALAVETAILQKDRRYFLCERPECSSCRSHWTFNRMEMIGYYQRALIARAGALLRRPLALMSAR